MSSTINIEDLELSKIFVVIPGYNEGEVLEKTVNEVTKLGYQVIYVDDCSRDNSWEISKQLNIYKVRHPLNLGQGGALQTGFDLAKKLKAEIVVTFDSDGQHDPHQIAKVIDPIIKNKAQVVLGSRFIEKDSTINMPVKRKLLLRLATIFTSLTTGLKLTDTHNGFRALSKSALDKIYLRQNRMAHASEILSLISENNLSYVEVPVTIRYTDYSLRKGQKMTNIINILWESFTGKLR